MMWSCSCVGCMEMNSGRNADITGSLVISALRPLSSLDELNYSEIMVHECHQLLFTTRLLLCKMHSKRTVTQWFVEALQYIKCYCHYNCVYWLYIAHTEFLMYWVFLLLNQCYALCHARKQSNMAHWLTYWHYRLSAWCRQWDFAVVNSSGEHR